MNREQHQQRKEVLAHYERLMECKTREEFHHEGWMSASCVLCRSYRECHNCPISVHTGLNWCTGTPWLYMHYAILRFVHYGGESPHQAVVDMYEFLKTVDFGVKE